MNILAKLFILCTFTSILLTGVATKESDDRNDYKLMKDALNDVEDSKCWQASHLEEFYLYKVKKVKKTTGRRAQKQSPKLDEETEECRKKWKEVQNIWRHSRKVTLSQARAEFDDLMKKQKKCVSQSNRRLQALPAPSPTPAPAPKPEPAKEDKVEPAKEDKVEPAKEEKVKPAKDEESESSSDTEEDTIEPSKETEGEDEELDCKELKKQVQKNLEHLERTAGNLSLTKSWHKKGEKIKEELTYTKTCDSHVKNENEYMANLKKECTDKYMTWPDFSKTRNRRLQAPTPKVVVPDEHCNEMLYKFVSYRKRKEKYVHN